MKVKNILVSQPEPLEMDKSPYGDIIRKYSVNIDFHKFFKVEGVSSREFRNDKVYLNEFTAVIFTSKNAVDNFFRIAKEVRVDVPESMKYFCVSESIAYYLQKYVQFRKRKIFHGDQNLVQLMEVIKKHKMEKFLLPCSDVHNKDLPNLLEASSIEYREAILYRTVSDDLAGLNIDKYDLLVFFSPQGIKSLYNNFPDFVQGTKLIGAFGPSTAIAASEAGLTVEILAPTNIAPSMTMAIDQYLTKNNRK
ncbi:MAG: uroporphyrinogen-III synthase [Bacteroidales bacterium]